VKREPAKDDPGPEQARRNRQDQDLHQAALDEGLLKGLEHRQLLALRPIAEFSVRGSALTAPRAYQE
jgi:hypothetical protein